MAVAKVPSFDGSGVTFVTSPLGMTSGDVYDITAVDLRAFDLGYDDDYSKRAPTFVPARTSLTDAAANPAAASGLFELFSLDEAER